MHFTLLILNFTQTYVCTYSLNNMCSTKAERSNSDEHRTELNQRSNALCIRINKILVASKSTLYLCIYTPTCTYIVPIHIYIYIRDLVTLQAIQRVSEMHLSLKLANKL